MQLCSLGVSLEVEQRCGALESPRSAKLQPSLEGVPAANSLTSSQEDEMEEGVKKLTSHGSEILSASPWYAPTQSSHSHP